MFVFIKRIKISYCKFKKKCLKNWYLTVEELKACWQTSHENGFTPLCVTRTCLFKLDLSVYVIEHIVQEYDFGSSWFFKCRCRYCLCLKDFPHLSQEYIRVVLWVSLWLLRAEIWEKDFGQTSHLYGFSPVCVLSWI